MTGRYEFREDLLPICLLLTWQTLHAEDAAGVFHHYRSLCERRIRFVAISDVRAAERLPDAATYRSFGEEAKRFTAQSAPWCLGGAVIVRSPLIRGALNGIAWLYHAESPQFICGDMPSAVDWAVETLATHGITLSPGLQALALQLGSTGEASQAVDARSRALGLARRS